MLTLMAPDFGGAYNFVVISDRILSRVESRPDLLSLNSDIYSESSTIVEP